MSRKLFGEGKSAACQKGGSRCESGPVSNSRTAGRLTRVRACRMSRRATHVTSWYPCPIPERRRLASRDRSYVWQGVTSHYDSSSLAICLLCHRLLCRCCAAEDVTELYDECPVSNSRTAGRLTRVRACRMSRRATHVTSQGPCPIPERRRLSRVGPVV
jgi:hypothetical protein